MELLTQAATESDMSKLPKRDPTSETTTKKGKSTKREASKPIGVSDRVKAWNAIKQQHYRLHDDFQNMPAKQRQVNRIVSAYHDQCENFPPPGGL